MAARRRKATPKARALEVGERVRISDKAWIERIALGDLVPHPSNPRHRGERSVEAIRASLRTFGQTRTIVVDRNRTVLAGHGAMRAAELEGLDTLTATCVDLEGAEAIAYLIADNRTAELSTWLQHDLAKLLQELDAPLTEAAGYTDDDLAELLRDLEGPPARDTNAASEPAGGDPVPDVGDAERIERTRTATLYLGDCSRILPQLAGINADALFTDPPYGISFQSNMAKDGPKHRKLKGDHEPQVAFLAQLTEVMAPTSAALVWCRWDVQQAFYDAMRKADWTPRAQVVWDRMTTGMGDLQGSPSPQHDVAWWSTRGTFGFHGKRPSSVCRYRRVSGAKAVHPTMKPVPMVRSWIATMAPARGLVLDPFMGSGSTGQACAIEGRRFVGIELDPTYFEIALANIREAEDA